MLEVLAKAENPLSAEETHSKLESATCDLVTVYRSLEQFERMELSNWEYEKMEPRFIAFPMVMVITTI